MRAGGIILAAGFSSRMATRTGGGSKALLPLPGGTFLELAAAALRAGGVEDIWVVTGHDREAVENKTLELGLLPVENPNFASGMFSSVCAGLRAALNAMDAMDALLILPVDAPLVSPASIKALLDAAAMTAPEERTRKVFLPVLPNILPGAPASGVLPAAPAPGVFPDAPLSGVLPAAPAPGGLQGAENSLPPCHAARQRALLKGAGHPPLLGAALARAALDWNGQNGLQGYFASLPENQLEFIAISDSGIMSDIDTPEDYSRFNHA